jgi:hypothetical protein
MFKQPGVKQFQKYIGNQAIKNQPEDELLQL